MMEGVRNWLLTVIAASVLCALAEGLMPVGAVKGAGRFTCAMVLLCAILSPVAGLDLERGRGWLEGYLERLEEERTVLRQQVDAGTKVIIEEKYAAYIVDKAAEKGITCTVRVKCEAGEAGIYIPDWVEVGGVLEQRERERLAELIEEDLGVLPGRQAYYIKEELP